MSLQGSLVRAAQVAATLACLALLWRVAHGEAALRHLAAADPRWMTCAVVALTLQTVLSAFRWQLTARQLGIALGRRAAIAEYYLSQLVNQALPGGVLGDAGRALRARSQAGLLASGQAVLFERLAGQLGLVAIFAAGVVGTWTVPGGFDAPDWLLRPLSLFLLAGAAALLMLCYATGSVPDRCARVIPAAPLSAAAGLWAAFLQAVAAPNIRIRQLLLSLATALCNIAAFAFCASAIGLTLSPSAASVLVPLVLFSMLIPITISGWGLREGAAVSLLPLAGATSAEGLAASVAFGLAVILASLPGLPVALVALRKDPPAPS